MKARMLGTRRKLLWFVLFAALMGWFAKDGTNQITMIYEMQPW